MNNETPNCNELCNVLKFKYKLKSVIFSDGKYIVYSKKLIADGPKTFKNYPITYRT